MNCLMEDIKWLEGYSRVESTQAVGTILNDWVEIVNQKLWSIGEELGKVN